MITATYNIFAENLSPLMRLTARLNKRAAKLGLDPITVTKMGDVHIRNKDGVTVDHFITIEIAGETPVLNGYEFVATIQHAGEAGNILRVVPSFEGTLPERFRTADPGNCDHCRMYRRRNDTFVVMHTDAGAVTYHQVGRNCLVDFVGSEKVHSAAAMAEMISLLGESAEGMGVEHGRRGESTMLLEPAVAWAAEAMFRGGWISRTKAQNENKFATVDAAILAMDNHKNSRKCNRDCGPSAKCLNHFVPSDEAKAHAAKVLEWAPSWLEREMARSQDSDYIWNMNVVLAGETIAVRSYGLAASVLGAYQREQEYRQRIAIERAEQPESNWIGTVGEKLVLALTVKAVRFLDTGWGVKSLITYVSEEGNIVKWFATGHLKVTEGQTETLEMTVKEHREYNGIKETHVQRVKVYQDKATKAAQAKARKIAKAKYDSLQKEVEEAWAAEPGGETYRTKRQDAEAAYKEWQAI